MNNTSIQPGAAQVLVPLSGVAPLPRVAGQTAPDGFGRSAGPDAEIAFETPTVRAYAHFQVDPETKEMKVSVVDESGKLIRLIPADSVRQMIAAMAAYHGR
jgi:hypothetical protein